MKKTQENKCTMKNTDDIAKKILEDGIPSNYASTATAAQHGASGSSLTLADIRKAVKFLMSDEYKEMVNERQRLFAMGEVIAYTAYRENAIDDMEFVMCIRSLAFNGALIVSPELANKLRPIAEKIGKDGVYERNTVPTVKK